MLKSFHVLILRFNGRLRGGGAGGDSAYERAGMLVVSLRGVNFGFWSHLRCFGQNTIIFSREGLV